MKHIASWLLGLAMGAGLVACVHLNDCPPAPPSVTVLTVPGDSASDALTFKLPEVISSHQADVLAQAKRTAETDGIEPGLLQGILLNESDAGSNPHYKVTGPKGERQYGVGQIELPTALRVMATYPELWATFGFHTHTDEEVIAKLIENDAFNIAVASKYTIILRHSGYKSAASAAVAYHKGPGGAIGVDAKTDRYAMRATAHIRPTVIKVTSGIYHVVRGDTLSGIAVQFRMSIAAIMSANPTAFPGHNADILMAGADLILPTVNL
jgi:LysM repeat protein